MRVERVGSVRRSQSPRSTNSESESPSVALLCGTEPDEEVGDGAAGVERGVSARATDNGVGGRETGEDSGVGARGVGTESGVGSRAAGTASGVADRDAGI